MIINLSIEKYRIAALKTVWNDNRSKRDQSRLGCSMVVEPLIFGCGESSFHGSDMACPERSGMMPFSRLCRPADACPIGAISMRRATAICLIGLACPLPATAAPAKTEHWVATSRTAMAITGDISLSPTRILMAGKSLSLAVAADVPAFETLGHKTEPARILRVTEPSDPILLNGNTLCGRPVRWIAVYRADGGKSLNMSAFSGNDQPNGETDQGLCGTFFYSR